MFKLILKISYSFKLKFYTIPKSEILRVNHFPTFKGDSGGNIHLILHTHAI